MEVAGIPADEALEFHRVAGTIDAEDLTEAIHAICNRDTVVPGCQAFSVDRVTEERLVREIANARHKLLDEILGSSELLSAIIHHAESVLAGENAPDTFTDLDIDVTDEDNSVTEFSANLQELRNALVTGIEVGGRARRKTIDALDDLQVSHSCLRELADELRSEAGRTITKLLAAYDCSTEEFLVAHLPFARRETAKMAGPDEDPEELFQEAYFGMRRAAERFDPARGVRFYSYALYWIRQQIDRWRKNSGSMIRVPVHRHELYAKITTFVEEFHQSYLRLPSEEEVSEAMGCDAKVFKLLALALSEPLDFRQEMKGAPDPSCSPEGVAMRRQAEEVIRREIDSLEEREGNILRMRFGVGRETDMTLEEVGQSYGVTRERIRQIEAKALLKLGHPRRARFLRGLL